MRNGSRVLILTLLLLTVTIGFQNCIGFQEFNLQNPISSEQFQSRGNGEGYDGKIFNLVRTDKVCSDGNPIANTILVKDGIGLMIRQNCLDLSPQERFEVPLVFSNQDKRILIYGGEEYLLQYIQYSAIKRDSASQMLAMGTVWNAAGANLASLTHLGVNGSPDWSLTYDHDFKNQTLAFNAVASISDGWLVSGNPMDLRLESALRTPQPAFVAKFDQTGSPQWVRSYGQNLTDGQKLHFKGVRDLGSGRTLVAATFEVYPSGASVVAGSTPTTTASGLLWFDSSGNLLQQQWWKQVWIGELHATSDGHSLIVGRQNGQQMLAKIDNTGVVWARRLDLKIESTLIQADGRIAFSGTQESNSSSRSRAAIALMTADGNLSWARSFATADESGMSVLHDLVENPNQGFYTVGFADRTGGRVASYYQIDLNGNLVNSAELKPGYSARWKKAFLFTPDSLWTSLVNSDFTRIENSLNEVLLRLNPQTNPPCPSCLTTNPILSTDLLLNSTEITLEATSSPLSDDARPLSLRPRSLGYPIFVSP